MISDQFMLAKALFNEDHKPKLVVIGVNPRDFMDNSFQSVNSTDAFNYLRPYVDLKGLGNYAFTDLFSWLNWQIEGLPARQLTTRYAPTIAGLENKIFDDCLIRLTQAARAQNDKVKTAASPAGAEQNVNGTEQVAAGQTAADQKADDHESLKAIYGNTQEVTAGKWKVVASTWGAFQDNTREYAMRYKNPDPPIYPIEKRFFEEFLAYLQAEDIKVLVVGMPSLWPNRALLPEKFWKDFRADVAASTTKYGGTWLDLYDDPRFNNTDYLDTVHLNPAGGFKLVRCVVDSIADNNQLAFSVRRRQMADKTPPRVAPDYWQ